MKKSSNALRMLGVGLAWTVAAVAGTGTARAASEAPASVKALDGTYLPVIETRQALSAGRSIALVHSPLRASASAAAAAVAPRAAAAAAAAASSGGLPLWTFDAYAARDGLRHKGAMVGTNPFTSPGTSKVAVEIIPVILKLHTIGVSFDPTTLAITTTAGDTLVDPAAPDNTCLSAPNNVPARLLRQSPLFTPTSFNFGPTYVGTTQYIDAFQRANFLYASEGVASSYHLLFDPVEPREPIVIDVPAEVGLAVTNPLFFGPPAICAPLAIIDIAWFDQLLNDQVLPALASEGVSPANLPLFFLYNTVLGEPVTNLGSCCILGYHSSGGFPTPTQTYAVSGFDSTGSFGPTIENTSVIAHELGEWANDPFGINLVPPWGGTGQVEGCQGNLEVGDPLTGTVMPPITMPNGFTYNVQELAFFSWFFGGRSIGANGWYSGNDTFTTDAGTPCLLQ